MPMMQRRSEEDDVLADINVIPLVDIVLVLLIIFMLTAPMLTRTMDIRLPRARAAELKQEERLVISITKDGIYYFEKVPVAPDQLETFVRTHAPRWQRGAVYVRADRVVPYETVVRLLDVLRRYGILRIGLQTLPWVPEQTP